METAFHLELSSFLNDLIQQFDCYLFIIACESLQYIKIKTIETHHDRDACRINQLNVSVCGRSCFADLIARQHTFLQEMVFLLPFSDSALLFGEMLKSCIFLTIKHSFVKIYYMYGHIISL